MEYYNSEHKAPRRWAIGAVGLYVALCVLFMLTIKFSFEAAEPTEEGILVEFGDDDTGFGEEELLDTDVATTPDVPAPEAPDEQILTDDDSEVEIERPAEEEPKTKSEPTEQKPTEKKDSVAAQTHTVNKKALFPGRKEDSTATSSGTAENTTGNQGHQSGKNEGSSNGSGTGLTGVVELKNRSIVGTLPKPSYNADASGKVVVDITVDESGRVTSARYRQSGSTTTNSTLTMAAEKAAMKARFTSSDNFIQQGTITYTFRLN